MTLKNVLEAPSSARVFFEENKLIGVSIPNLMDRAGLFLGQFNRNEFGSMQFSVLIGDKAQGNCRAWERTFDKHRKQMDANEALVRPDGWAEFVFEKSPPSWQYVRRNDPPNLPKHLTSFNCDYFGYCTGTSCIGSNASFAYKFRHKTARKLERRDPKS